MDGNNNHRKLVALTCVMVIFLAALAGTAWWAVRTYLTPSKTIVLLQEDDVRQSRAATNPPLPAASRQRNPVNNSAPTFKGKVVDAQTKQPVADFTIHLGYTFNGNNQPPQYNNNAPRDFHGGQYTMTSQMWGGNMQWTLRIDARGYLPAVSDAQRGSGTVDFELQPGKDIQGVVVDAAGAPVAGALVGVAVPGLNLDVNTQKLSAPSAGSLKTTSGPDGRFDLPPQDGVIQLVAMNANGFASLDEDASTANPTLKLGPWAGIRGQLTVAGKPGAKQTIQIYSTTVTTHSGYVNANQSAITGVDGSFQFERVMPGSAQVGRMVTRKYGNNNMQTRITGAENVMVQAGQTLTVNLGGVGRSVTGKLIFPTGTSMKNYYLNDNINGNAAPPPPAPESLPPQMPDSVKNGPQANRDMWMSLFSMTAAGKDYLFKHPQAPRMAVFRQYAMEIADDGTYRIDDVLPGDYQINIFASMLQGGARQLNQFNTNITVPAVPGGGYSDQPVVLDITFTAR